MLSANIVCFRLAQKYLVLSANIALFRLAQKCLGRDINAKGAGRRQDLPGGGDLVSQRASQCKEKQERTLTRTL